MCGNKKEPHEEALKQICFGDSRSPKPWHKPSLWERVKDIFISPEFALLLAVAAILLNLYRICLCHIESYTL